MRIMHFILLLLTSAMPLLAQVNKAMADDLRKTLQGYISGKEARIGIAVVTDEGQFIGVNEDEHFPMLSVVKFPVALAVTHHLRESGTSMADTLLVTPSFLHSDTYSPMLQKYPSTRSHHIAVGTLLDYALKVSDNNACDVLMDYAGGASVVNDYVKRLGIDGINVRWNENAMNTSDARCRENTSTPAAMAQLMYRFDTEFQDSLSLRLKRIMETCETGTDRLARPLLPTNAVIGHKTGTGPVDKQTGKRMAVNDAGYVHLPNGRHYAIAVFVADSSYGMEETSAIIATLSDIVWKGLTAR